MQPKTLKHKARASSGDMGDDLDWETDDAADGAARARSSQGGDGERL